MLKTCKNAKKMSEKSKFFSEPQISAAAAAAVAAAAAAAAAVAAQPPPSKI